MSASYLALGLPYFHTRLDLGVKLCSLYILTSYVQTRHFCIPALIPPRSPCASYVTATSNLPWSECNVYSLLDYVLSRPSVSNEPELDLPTSICVPNATISCHILEGLYSRRMPREDISKFLPWLRRTNTSTIGGPISYVFQMWIQAALLPK